MLDSLGPRELHSPWNSPGLNNGVGTLSILQGIGRGDLRPLTSDQTCAPFLGRRSLHHWMAREHPSLKCGHNADWKNTDTEHFNTIKLWGKDWQEREKVKISARSFLVSRLKSVTAAFSSQWGDRLRLRAASWLATWRFLQEVICLDVLHEACSGYTEQAGEGEAASSGQARGTARWARATCCLPSAPLRTSPRTSASVPDTQWPSSRPAVNPPPPPVTAPSCREAWTTGGGPRGQGTTPRSRGVPAAPRRPRTSCFFSKLQGWEQPMKGSVGVP